LRAKGRQHHKAQRYFASRILDPANSIGADKVALALENSNHSSSTVVQENVREAG